MGMKNAKTHQFIVFFLLTFFYFLTRLYNLHILPLFTDETIYIYWAKFISTFHSNFFISVADGKPPLLIWLIGIFLQFVPQDAYWFAGRMVSVFAGWGTMIGIYALSYRLFSNKSAAVASAVLYILLPFTLFYDRLALFDSLLTTMLLWSLYFGIRFGQDLKTRDAVFTGSFLGLAFLTKPTALIYWGLMPFVIFLSIPQPRKLLRIPKSRNRIIVLVVLALFIAQVLNNSLRVSSVYYLMSQKNAQFARTLPQIVRDPIVPTINHLRTFADWLIAYYTMPLMLLVIFAFILLLTKKWRIGVLLLGLWFIPLLAFAVTSQIVFPRYLLFTTPFALLASGWLIGEFLQYLPKKRYLICIGLLFLCLPALKFSTALLIDPIKAPIPETDYQQYVSDHPSGYGMEEVNQFIASELVKGPITVVTEGTFGILPYGIQLVFWQDSRLDLQPQYPLIISQELVNLAKSRSVYVVFKDRTELPLELPLTLVKKIPKPGGKAFFIVGKVK
ncbi:hypothetical protein C4579_02060 [Candidatus Microgenomates bacterium]|nr:MAG: hypothetical protein C4579_02060 [Candidatus Microgenomates bacterium]